MIIHKLLLPFSNIWSICIDYVYYKYSVIFNGVLFMNKWEQMFNYSE